MITTNNYFIELNRIGVNNLPETLRKSHDFVVKSTGNGSTWENYKSNETIRKVIDLYLNKVNQFLASQPAMQKEKTVQQPAPKPPSHARVVTPSKEKNKGRSDRNPEHSRGSKKRSGNNKPGLKEESLAKKVAHIREEIKFIKRYVALHSKVKSPKAILNFIKALQRSIVQKFITKDSPLAAEIRIVQEALVKAYNSMKGDTKITLNEADLGRLVAIAGGEQVYPSISIIKRFIGMQGKELEEKRIDDFITHMERAVKKQMVSKDDPFADKANDIYKYLRKRKSGTTIAISKTELNGLEGIIKACSCKNDLGKIYDTNGNVLRRCKKKTYSDAGKGACSYNKGLNGVLTAEQMATRQFDVLLLGHPWDTLIGMPARNFTAMFHGEPGAGKTTFLLKFAKYLAENFGEVLYISSEEFASVTMTEKVSELLRPFPARLHFAENLKDPKLAAYDFIILDSVNDLGLRLNDYKALRKNQPDKAFILILQHTKDGKFRGGKDWEHTVEIAGLIDNGVASIYKNRYGVKGTMEVFGQDSIIPSPRPYSSMQ